MNKIYYILWSGGWEDPSMKFASVQDVLENDYEAWCSECGEGERISMWELEINLENVFMTPHQIKHFTCD